MRASLSFSCAIINVLPLQNVIMRRQSTKDGETYDYKMNIAIYAAEQCRQVSDAARVESDRGRRVRLLNSASWEINIE